MHEEVVACAHECIYEFMLLHSCVCVCMRACLQEIEVANMRLAIHNTNSHLHTRVFSHVDVLVMIPHIPD